MAEDGGTLAHHNENEIKAWKIYCVMSGWTRNSQEMCKLYQCNMCNAIVQDMNSHLATCSCYCQYCRIATVMSEHKEKCPKFPLQCAYCKLQVLLAECKHEGCNIINYIIHFHGVLAIASYCTCITFTVCCSFSLSNLCCIAI